MILLVDDEPAVARLYGAMIQRRGFDVRTCPDGPEALELLHERRFHLVLCDVDMPGMDGHELCRRIVARGRRRAPLLLFSAHDRVRDVVAGLEAGADDFLLKGADLHALLDRMSFWLTAGFRNLPGMARAAALRALAGYDPRAPMLGRLVFDRSLIEPALESLHREFQATPPAFGERLVERIHLLGRATALLAGQAGEPEHFLRFPDALVRLVQGLRLPWAGEARILLAHFDLLARDPRFLEAAEIPLAELHIAA